MKEGQRGTDLHKVWQQAPFFSDEIWQHTAHPFKQFLPFGPANPTWCNFFTRKLRRDAHRGPYAMRPPVVIYKGKTWVPEKRNSCFQKLMTNKNFPCVLRCQNESKWGQQLLCSGKRGIPKHLGQTRPGRRLSRCRGIPKSPPEQGQGDGSAGAGASQSIQVRTGMERWLSRRRGLLPSWMTWTWFPELTW